MLDALDEEADDLDIKFLGMLVRHKRYVALRPGRSLVVTAAGDEVCSAPRYQANAAARAGLIEEFREGNGWSVYRASAKGRARWFSWRHERERLLSEIRKLRKELDEALLEHRQEDVECELYPGLNKSRSRIVGMLKRRSPNVCSVGALVNLCPRSSNATTLVRVHISHIRKARPDLEIESVVGVGYRLISGDPRDPQP